MAKLDGLKELLNNLRVGATLAVLFIIALTSGLINRLDKDKIDYLFYMGAIIDLAFMIILLYIFKRIEKVTKEIKYTK